MDRGDDRLLALLDGCEAVLKTLDGLVQAQALGGTAGLRAVAAVAPEQVAHGRLEVEAGGEHSAFGPDDDRAHLVIGVQLAERAADLVEERERHRVELVGVVEDDLRHRSVVVDPDATVFA